MTIAIITEAGVRKVAPLVVVAQQAAAAAQLYAGVAQAAVGDRIYPTYAAGNADTIAGEYFFVASSGSYALYIHGTATALAPFPVLDPATGNLGVGVVPAVKLHAKSTGEMARLETTTPRGNGAASLGIYDPTGRKGVIGYATSAEHIYIRNDLTGHVIIATDGVNRWLVTSTGSFEPDTDNTNAIGRAGARPTTIYAVTGTINTSDEREKTWRGGPTSGELSAARRIASELGFFQWNDAIAEKGEDDARVHFGVRAQAVWDIMADEGLIDALAEGETPDSRYAFLCYDEWEAIAPVEAVEEVRDEDDNVIVEAHPAHPGQPAGNRFGIRPDQLALFLIAAQEARLAALEA